ncbi:uncharacterized mitochondrial protein AtMg00810-like [Diospyros lotus]|uniref:uncharacterized mitochondrial protein AtMg00810-like n=1 Tax=Diospyros lotus TaxID=55363 RepID=UPI0022536AC5|nr:uncharacterized mitochondrial protein AtMg00810-like [Diospyros lotus]
MYVDDIVIAGDDKVGIEQLKTHLHSHFQTKNLGRLKYFLGIEVAQFAHNVRLSQRKYIKSAPGKGLLFENKENKYIVGYTNADWAAYPIDRRSTLGYCILFAGNLVS